MILQTGAKFVQKLTPGFKSHMVWRMTWGEIWQTFTRVLESLEIVTLMGSSYPM